MVGSRAMKASPEWVMLKSLQESGEGERGEWRPVDLRALAGLLG